MAAYEPMCYKVVSRAPKHAEQIFAHPTRWVKLGPESSQRCNLAYNQMKVPGDKFFVTLGTLKSYKFELFQCLVEGIIMKRDYAHGTEYLCCKPIRGPSVEVEVEQIRDDDGAQIGWSYKFTNVISGTPSHV